jgi:hypothetical protein
MCCCGILDDADAAEAAADKESVGLLAVDASGANLGQETIGFSLKIDGVIWNYQHYIQYFLIGIHKNRRVG